MKSLRNIFLLCSLLGLFSCSDFDDVMQNSTSVEMRSFPFYKDERFSTRTSLSQTGSEIAFRWNADDVCGVYSEGRGLTNFFIDPSSISYTGMSADFKGSGFKLNENEEYYAFSPYDGNNLDKSYIPLDYTSQYISGAGDYSGLGKCDYMFSHGITDASGKITFDFEHLGCVASFKFKMPTTINISRAILTYYDEYGAKLQAKGYVDLTEPSPIFRYGGSDSDSIISVNCSGFTAEQDSTIEIPVMFPPQKLANGKINLRLIDNSNRCVEALFRGKNMRPGYYYSYSLEDLDEVNDISDATGTGCGFPLDDEYDLQYVSAYTNGARRSYEGMVIDNNDLYAVGSFGLRKIDYTNADSPMLKNQIQLSSNADLYGRCIDHTENYLYIGMRQNSPGETYKYAPQLCYDFENVDVSTFQLSNDAFLNKFFEVFETTEDISQFTHYFILKAYFQNKVYRNAIKFKRADGSYYIIYEEKFSTREQALNALRSCYGQCKVNWNDVSEGMTASNRFKLNHKAISTTITSDSHVTCDMQGDRNPNRGQNSCRFSTKSVQGKENSAFVKYFTSAHSKGEISFWLNYNGKMNASAEIPLLWNNGENIIKIGVESNGNSYSVSLESNRGFTQSTSVKLQSEEWYNIKAQINSNQINLYCRNKEAGQWQQIASLSLSGSISFDGIGFGLSTDEKNLTLLVDDYYFNDTDLDAVSYVNGALVVVDKATMSICNKYNLDVKATDVKVHNNVLILDCLYGCNIYKIDNGREPVLTYTYRHPSYKEFQGIGLYEVGNRTYAFMCNYSLGYTILDVTNPDEVSIVKMDESYMTYNGQSMKYGFYNFDVIVDYPYVYMTHLRALNQQGTDSDYRGIQVLDISDINNVKRSLYTVPVADLCIKPYGDKCPVRIERFRNSLYIDNGDKGLLRFDIKGNGQLEYKGPFSIPGCQSAFNMLNDGNRRFFIAEDCYKNLPAAIHLYKIK